nr:spore coat U domain-containing protein [Dyella sp. 2HG41-7]
MPPPAEPVDALPPSAHPLPPHTEPVPAAAECTIMTNDIYLRSYRSGQSNDVGDSMGMTMICTQDVRVLVRASPSPESADFQYRLLRQESGGATLRYQLYTDYGRSQIWGNGEGQSVPINRSVSAGSTTLDVFATIFAHQSVPPGRYSDTVIVTIDVE